MTHRLLLVEQSATMREVIEKHAESLGFAVSVCSGYEQAAALLDKQFQTFGADFAGVIFGWPTTPQDDAAVFAQRLEISEYKDLPVVVMSTDMRAETRAWVAGRENTEVLVWKDYQRLHELLSQLIDTGPSIDESGDVMPLSTDNQDVSLLIVDDSATIRFSLRDLFQKQGYQITLAATHEEAIRCATDLNIDIAIIDYYLVDTTGDALCSELLASAHTGDVVCTVLTGTYSNHIIKRSLRAGAVECMFKNESSELLVSRIDAISRFVRQKRQLRAEQQLLEDVLEFVAGAVVLINNENRISYVNTLAVDELGLKDRSVLIGQSSTLLFEDSELPAPDNAVHGASWRLPGSSQTVDVDCQHQLIKTSGCSLLRFTRRIIPIANADLLVLQQSHDPNIVVDHAIRQFSLRDECKPFLIQLQNYLNDQDTSTQNISTQKSLLILDVVPTSISEAQQVSTALHSLSVRDHHVAELGENRYGILLRHTEQSQVYILTRKVMQHCLQAGITTPASGDEATLVCRGSLLSLTRNASQPLNVLLDHVFQGMDIVNARQANQTLLLDVRRLLTAFPVEG